MLGAWRLRFEGYLHLFVKRQVHYAVKLHMILCYRGWLKIFQ